MASNSNLDQSINNLMSRHRVVGLSALVVKGGQVIWAKGYGAADLARGIPVDTDTIYRIASISKTVMATALMQQWEQGKFGLDDDISDYLGYLVRNPKYPQHPITFKQLFTHTSSLIEEQTSASASLYYQFLSASRSANPPLMEEYLLPGGTYYTADMWGSYAPGGTTFNYSNLASGVLATVVEKLSGERFDQYCMNHIFSPLGITGSFNIQDIDINNVSVLYDKSHTASADNYRGVKPAPIDYSQYQPGSNGLIFSPQGGLRISPLELSKFMLAHMHGGSHQGVQILQPATVALMHQTHWTGNVMGGFYTEKGLNFQITDQFVQGERMLGHYGDAYGLASDMYFSEEKEFGMIFMINGSSQRKGKGVFYAVVEDLVNLLYPELILS